MPLWVLALSCLGAFWVAALPAQEARWPASYERAAGSPGTATPQPFVLPRSAGLPGTAPQHLPLLNDGTGNRGGALNPRPDGPLPADGRLPLLERQPQRQR
ncbi:hypothetical protein LPB260_27490 [Pseudomonas sp. LPB0260]|uniref:hypothetical protein n=1 Tax=Pseudomonas sp. LPB0260 TaxID=2614442 RepID=UPI0015C1E739|nr:hypothetical protein [Pseudomonas sp. LPB0260]QLC74428.1 hypothetical protein LPB260_12540 [Pseudomonas sp. LPB0260]QLC77198.1 hypothetical protein LPB260_27490 [Pseudomonas sp. LPB0260]